MSKKPTAEWQRNKRLKRKTHLRNLLGGVCAKCGSIDRLEFDHKNPASVLFRIAGQNLCRNMQSLLEEAAKCQLLCHNCHWEKTRAERNYELLVHGTVNMYNNHKCRCRYCRSAWAKYIYPRQIAYRKKVRNVPQSI